ncbi:MAG: type II/IV secretion system protein [Holosporales bacterium]|nr:type II/IV secretion system protein [Holosporales bacterium]
MLFHQQSQEAPVKPIEDDDTHARSFLVENGILKASQVSVIEKEQARSGTSFAEAALSLHLIDETHFLTMMGNLYALEIVDLDRIIFDASYLSFLPRELAVACSALIIDVRESPAGSIAKIALADPGDLLARDQIALALPSGTQIEFVLALERQILSFYANRQNDTSSQQVEIPQLAYLILQEAIERRASDLHFEPEETLIQVRLRIDGALVPSRTLHRGEWPRICGHLKILSNLNITEHRKPQSGHARIRTQHRWVDLRISTHPSLFGEALVIRILDARTGLLTLSELGFSPEARALLDQVLATPSGMFLVVGPTGSGKTTTLYALLQALKPEERNIMTLEDPVEYQIPRVRQLDLREEGILSFAEGIRSALRQDPDVILVGEIRDESTALMALRAALTGRLVLATLHARDVFATFDRLQDLGLPSREIIPHLVGIIAQRLVPKSQEILDSSSSLKRQALAEILYFSPPLRTALMKTENHALWRDVAFRHGFLPFPTSGTNGLPIKKSMEDYASLCL